MPTTSKHRWLFCIAGGLKCLLRLEKLYQFFEDEQIGSKDAEIFLQQKIYERDRLIPGHTDALLFSLDRLVRHAARQGVILGLENRFHYHELPTPTVFETLLTEFKGGPIGYWHDTGHAHANEALGIIEPGALLQKFGNDIVGMHWHDARGLDDHLAPGQGEIDFNSLNLYIREDLPLVIELKPGTSNQEVKESIQVTREYLISAAKSHKIDLPS